MINKKIQYKTHSTRAQEEMVGFALIIILVAIILLVFLAISLNKPKTEATENYEAGSFLQAALQYTSKCQSASGIKKFYSVKELIFECNSKSKCADEKETCGALNETLSEILKESWPTGENRPNKAYELSINANEESLLIIKESERTNSCKSASQSFAKSRKNFFINFEVCE